jgi:hypothetical protein
MGQNNTKKDFILMNETFTLKICGILPVDAINLLLNVSIQL